MTLSPSEIEQHLTDRGWPRPVVSGWPIPWVSPSNDLSKTNGPRHIEVVELILCQVCGVGHEPGSKVFLVLNHEGPTPEAGVDEFWAEAIDDAIMHERCLRLAAGRCPILRGLREVEKLVILTCPIEGVSKQFSAEWGRDRLTADGEFCTVVDTDQFLSGRS